MNLLLVTPYYPPQNAVASRRTHAFATCWAGCGERVTVLTTAKRQDQQGLNLTSADVEIVEIDFRGPALLERLRQRHRNIENDGNDGSIRPRSSLTNLLRRMKEHSGIYGSVRMPDLTDYWQGPALRWCQESRRVFDVVISSSGPYTAHLVAMHLKRRGLARRWVADFRDLWTDNHIFPGLFPFTLRERMLEGQCLREADLIVTVTEGLAKTLQAKCSQAVEVIYNGFDNSDPALNPSSPAHAADGPVTLVYTGTTYPQGQDPTPLLRAMRALKSSHPNLLRRLQLKVAGKLSERWLEIARSEQVQDLVSSMGIVSRADALQLQREAGALILLDWTSPDQGVLTGKVFEYLNAKAPILVIGGRDGSPISGVVHQARRGVHLGTDIEQIERTLITIIDGVSPIGSQPNADYVATFARQHQSMRLLDIMRGRFLDQTVNPSQASAQTCRRAADPG